MVLAGLEHPWYALAMLHGDPTRLPFLTGGMTPTREDTQTRILPFLRKFLRWIPDLLPLSDRISVATRKDGLQPAPIGTRLGFVIDYLYFTNIISANEFGSFVHDLTNTAQRVYEIYQSRL